MGCEPHHRFSLQHQFLHIGIGQQIGADLTRVVEIVEQVSRTFAGLGIPAIENTHPSRGLQQHQAPMGVGHGRVGGPEILGHLALAALTLGQLASSSTVSRSRARSSKEVGENITRVPGPGYLIQVECYRWLDKRKSPETRAFMRTSRLAQRGFNVGAQENKEAGCPHVRQPLGSAMHSPSRWRHKAADGRRQWIAAATMMLMPRHMAATNQAQGLVLLFDDSRHRS